MKVFRVIPIAAALLAASAVLGCGSSGAGGSGTSTRETIQPLPSLPAGWRTVVNANQGFALGLPRVWRSSQGRGGMTLLSSPDNRVAISIAADRSDDALSQPLASYASGALMSVPGIGALRAGPAVAFRDFYEAMQVRGSGRSANGVRQSLLLIALRRKGLSTFVALIARRSAAGASLYEPAVLRIIRTLRGRPVEASG